MIVTGSSKGIAEDANNTVAKIQASGGKAVAVEADISPESGIRRLVEVGITLYPSQLK